MGGGGEQRQLLGRNYLYPRWLLEEERNGWNVRKGADNSSNSLRQRPTRPGLFPWWEGNEEGGTGGRKTQALALLLLPLSLSRSLSLGLSFNLSFSEKSFLEVKNNFFFLRGKNKIPMWRDRSSRKFRHRFQIFKWQELRQDEVSTLCKVRKILLTLSVCKNEKISPGLGYFLLSLKFLVMHLLYLLTAFPVMKKYNLLERGRQSREGERQRQRERN